MSNENQKPADTRSASQKIQDLENALMSLYQTVDNLARDNGAMKEALKLLNNKLDSVMKASVGGEPLTDAVISRIMIENNVAELADKVNNMVAQGILKPTDQVAEDSFLVGAEIDEEGKAANPRIQFAAYAIQPQLREKLLGTKPGDVVVMGEGKMRFQLNEVYQIQQQKQEEAPAPAAPEQSTQEAPADPASQAAPAAAPEAAPAAPAQPDQSAAPTA